MVVAEANEHDNKRNNPGGKKQAVFAIQKVRKKNS